MCVAECCINTYASVMFVYIPVQVNAHTMHTHSIHDRKISVLGFCSILQCPVRPAPVLTLAPKIVPTVVSLLEELIDTYKSMYKSGPKCTISDHSTHTHTHTHTHTQWWPQKKMMKKQLLRETEKLMERKKVRFTNWFVQFLKLVLLAFLVR